MRVHRLCVTTAIVGVLLLQPALAEKKTATGAKTPSATIELASEQMRLIYGGSAGKGTIHFQGKDYHFTFKTASAGLGAKAVTSVTAKGFVYNLQKIQDFEGKYTAVSKGVVAGSAQAKATYNHNDNDVSVELVGTVKGAGLSMGAGMATIKLVKE
jgi:hypothetical protein